MKLTLDVDKILEKVAARRQREAWLRRCGVRLLRDWRPRRVSVRPTPAKQELKP